MYQCSDTECQSKSKYIISENCYKRSPKCTFCQKELVAIASVVKVQTTSFSFNGTGFPTNDIKKFGHTI